MNLSDAVVTYCTCGHRFYSAAKLEYIVCRKCGLDERPAPPSAPKPEVVGGPEHWGLLHRYRQDGAWDHREARIWLERWIDGIPRYGCDCGKHFAEIIKRIPIDTSSYDSMFAWGVKVHNAVNKRLGKPEIDINEAIRIWK